MKKTLATTVLFLGSFILLNANPDSDNGSSENLSMESEISHQLSQNLKDHVQQVVQEAIIQMTDSPIQLHITIHDGRLEVGQPSIEAETDVVEAEEFSIETCVENDFTKSMHHAQVIADELIKPILIEYGNFTKTDELVDEFKLELLSFWDFTDEDIDLISMAKTTEELLEVLSNTDLFIEYAKLSMANDLIKEIDFEYGPLDITEIPSSKTIIQALNKKGMKPDDLNGLLKSGLKAIGEDEFIGYRVNAAIISTKQIEDLMYGVQKLQAFKEHIWDSFGGSEGYDDDKVYTARSSVELINAIEKIEGASQDEETLILLDELINYEEEGFHTFLDDKNPPEWGDFDKDLINEIYGYNPLAFNEGDTLNISYVLKQGRNLVFNPELFYNSVAMYELIFEYMKFFIIKDFVEPTIPEEFFEELRVSYDCWYGHHAELWGDAWSRECETVGQDNFHDLIWTLTKYITNFIQKDRRLSTSEQYDKHSFDHISKKKWLKALNENNVMCRFDAFRRLS